MLRVEEFDDNNPSQFICGECGSEVSMVIHRDYIAGYCCGRGYSIPLSPKVWNCCSSPENGCGYECERKEKWR